MLIVLSTKVCEELRRVRDIINAVLYVKNQINNQQQYQQPEPDQEVISELYGCVPELSLVEYTNLKDMVFKAEQKLLRLVNFQFDLYDIQRPLMHLLRLSEILQLDRDVTAF